MFTDFDMYYISVDGGASNTEFCIYNTITKAEKHFFSGSSNFKNPESDAKKALIDDGINRVFKEMKINPFQIKGLVMGLSGFDSQKDYDYFINIADMSGIERKKIYICNDCELTFFSKGTPPGLSIVAGTGSIATGIAKDFSKTRSGGWGNAISDEGSGGWIGISVIKDFLRYYDGYGEYHHVFDIIREHLGESSFDELPGTLSQGSVKETAGFAKLVMDEADKGDKYCSCLTDKAAELVAEIACSVYKKLNFSDEISVDVVMSGSLFKSPSFYKAFKNYLNAMTMRNNFNFCGDVLSPVMGGITLACSMFA